MARGDPDFDRAGPMLLGLAYRILGSRADAEDAVQDTYLKWRSADRSRIDTPSAWLTTACTRRCIDLLRAAHRRRVDYVGAWLPEPVETVAAGSDPGPEARLALASSLSTAFLLLLERLTPKERAAYLLHEIFDVPYPEIARILDLREEACRKLVSRARDNVQRERVRHVTPPDRREQLLAAFEAALATGSVEPLAPLLSADVVLSVDSGGKVPSLDRLLHGRDAVLDFVAHGLHRFWQPQQRTATLLNGGPGLVVRRGGTPTAAVSFAVDDAGAVTAVYIMRNPDKLARLGAAAVA